MIQRILFLLFASIPLITMGQEVRLCHEQVAGPNQTDSLKIYLKSLNSDSVAIRGVNLSVAFHDSCAKYVELFGPFSDIWGAFFEDTLITTNLNLNYANQVFDNRLQYGNSDPSLVTPKILYAPPIQDSALLAITFIFEGACAANVYLEDESENPVNQIGNEIHNRMDYLLESCQPVSTPVSELFVEEKLQAWPVPSHEQLYFHPGEVGKQAFEVRIISMEGKIQSQRFFPIHTSSEALKLDTRNLPAGVYLLELHNKESMNRIKFIVNHK